MNNANPPRAQLHAHKSNLFVNKYLPSKLLHFPRIKRHGFARYPCPSYNYVFTRCNCIYISFQVNFSAQRFAKHFPRLSRCSRVSETGNYYRSTDSSCKKNQSDDSRPAEAAINTDYTSACKNYWNFCQKVIYYPWKRSR